jgi:hypothetical protein
LLTRHEYTWIQGDVAQKMSSFFPVNVTVLFEIYLTTRNDKNVFSKWNQYWRFKEGNF